MTALIVIGVLVLLIAGLMLIPIGADIGYEGGEFHVSAKVCGVLLQLFPKKPEDGDKPKKEKKPKRVKKKKNPPDGEEKPKKKRKLSFNQDEILSLLRSVLKSFGRFGRAFHVDRFLLRYTAAGDDPYDTAVTYGAVNAVLSGLAPLCRQRFKVKDCQVSTDVDFLAQEMSLDFGLAVTLRIGRIFGLLFSILFAGLGLLIKNKLRLAKEKRRNRKQEGPDPEKVISIDEIKEENTQAEERMDSNG